MRGGGKRLFPSFRPFPALSLCFFHAILEKDNHQSNQVSEREEASLEDVTLFPLIPFSPSLFHPFVSFPSDSGEGERVKEKNINKLHLMFMTTEKKERKKERKKMKKLVSRKREYWAT